ncbi:MAG: M15 family metallopeptidase [Ignavibacteriales bacterium]|nr:M15 family metallopeptidase [Ignavibacteriales bacterium]
MKTTSKIILILFFFSVSTFLQSQSISSELIPVKELIPNIVIDLKYASTDNVFNNQKLYASNECYLLKELVMKLQTVQDSLNKIRTLNSKNFPNGIGIKIWDGYRPRSIQYIMFEIFPDPTFVADPATGSSHNRGGAVDLTLVDLSTMKELPMPTKFDDFTAAAGHDFPGNLLPADVLFNREFLKKIMTELGEIDFYIAEWWHYSLKNNKDYPLLDFQMK